MAAADGEAIAAAIYITSAWSAVAKTINIKTPDPFTSPRVSSEAAHTTSDAVKIAEDLRSLGKVGVEVSDAAKAAEGAEIAAQRALTLLQGQYRGAHFLTLHSPMVTKAELLTRATVGIANKAGKLIKNTATRFLNYRDMQAVINKARRAYAAAGGKGAQDVIIDAGKTIGEGYYKGTGAYATTSKAVVKFNDLGEVYTAFPLLP